MKRSEKIKKFLLRKRILVPFVLVVVIGGFAFASGGNKETVSIVTPTIGDLSRTVQATGQVTSNTDLALSFAKGGTVRSVRVAVGDKVTQGQVLASLDQGTELASLTQAKGALAAAQARLAKIREGASNEDIALAKVALDNAKNDLENTKTSQQTLVDNAYTNLLNSSPEAVPDGSASDYTAPTISGSYTLGQEGTIKLVAYYGGSATFTTTGLVSATGIISSTSPQPIGNTGLSIKFPSTASSSVTVWLIKLPNTNASNYTSNQNAYQAALKVQAQAVAQAQALVAQRQAELTLKQAQARPSDISLGEADVLSAEGGLQAAQAAYENTIIRAPAAGTVTKVDIKYGELADIKDAPIVIQDIDHLYVEADINESNIQDVVLGQTVSLAVDALPGKTFSGEVVHIDPASTTVDGVVNYKIKVSINEKDPAIRSGMNAQIVINVWTHQNVIALPKAAIMTNDGTSSVYVITNEKRKTYESRTVTVSGSVGDGNLAEVINGVSATDKIALVTKK